MLAKVAVLVIPGMAPFEFGVLCEVFGIDRTEDGVPAIDFRVVAAEPGVQRFQHGLDVVVPHGLDFAEDADLVAVPAFFPRQVADDRLLEVLRRAHARGAWVLSICSGAFALAQAGLLDGRRCTTHWLNAAELADRFPTAMVDEQVLFVESGRIVTCAGTAAGMDAALHIVRREFGAQVANTIARRMVVAPQRAAGQAQYIDTPLPRHKADSLAAVLEWLEQHLDHPVTVEELAHRALMSPRTFARRFRAETGTTPAAWVNRRRVDRAQQLLETTPLAVDEVAREVGFPDAAALRHHFRRTLGTAPQAYRHTFAGDLGNRLTG